MRIGARFLLPPIAALLAIGALWALVSVQFAVRATELNATGEQTIEALRAIGRMNERNGVLRSNLLAFHLDHRADRLDVVAAAEREIETLAESYLGLARAAGDERGAALRERFIEARSAARRSQSELLVAIASRDEAWLRAAFEKWSLLGRTVDATLTDLAAHGTLRLQRVVRDTGARQAAALWWGTYGFAIAAVLAISFMGLSGRNLARRHAALAKELRSFSAERLDSRLDPRHTAAADELGELARAFDAMVEKIAESRAAISLERAQRDEALADLEAFTSSVTHDLRAPLRATEGYMRRALEGHAGRMDGELERLVRLAHENAGRMGGLIDAMLRLARAAQQPLHLRALDGWRQVAEALALLEPQRSGREVEIVVGELGTYRGDESLVRQVWVNLIGNAIKFTALRREARIEIGMHDDGGPQRTFHVRDNGAGFDMARAAQLFVPFRRLHEEREFPGTGVGLAIVERVVRRHGGRAWAQAAAGGGATFFFTVPKQDDPMAAA